MTGQNNTKVIMNHNGTRSYQSQQKNHICAFTNGKETSQYKRVSKYVDRADYTCSVPHNAVTFPQLLIVICLTDWIIQYFGFVATAPKGLEAKFCGVAEKRVK
jgi:hypothetical protein